MAQSGPAPDAPDAPADASGWQFTVAPYLLAPALDGDVTLRGRDLGVDLSRGDIFSNLNLGFMGYFEASKDRRWGVAADVIYANLDIDDDARRVEADLTQGIYSGAVLVRVGPAVELYAGGRLVSLENSAEFQGPLGLTVRQDRTWVDPLVGGRVSVPLGGRWDLTAAADVGGFGLGSDIAVNVWPVVTYRFSPGLRAAAGYRALYIDYESGTGTGRFAYDVWMHGPLLGLVAQF